jgi:hypothetical protein
VFPLSMPALLRPVGSVAVLIVIVLVADAA